MFVPSRLWSSQWSCMVVRAGPKRRQKARELMLLNCGAREDSWEFLDSWEIKPVNIKGNQPWILIGRTDAEAEAPVFWSPDANSQLIGKMMLGAEGEGGRRRRGYQRMRWLDGITDAMDMNLGKLLEMVKDREAWHAAVQGVTELDMTGQRNNNIIVLVSTKHQHESAIGLPIQTSVWWSECCRESGKYIAVWGLKKLKCVLFCKPSSTLPGTEL